MVWFCLASTQLKSTGGASRYEQIMLDAFFTSVYDRMAMSCMMRMCMWHFYVDPCVTTHMRQRETPSFVQPYVSLSAFAFPRGPGNFSRRFCVSYVPRVPMILSESCQMTTSVRPASLRSSYVLRAATSDSCPRWIAAGSAHTATRM